MSYYKNYIIDVPDRCLRLLELEPEAKKMDAEVTLLIAVAAQAIIMPLARLSEKNHPSGDSKKYLCAPEQLRVALSERCKTSSFFRGDSRTFEPDAWRFKQCDKVEANADCAEGMESIGDQKCGTIIWTIRHAAAHGNLRTDRSNPVDGSNPIKRLVFLSRNRFKDRFGNEVVDPRREYNRLECAPQVLQRFLRAWINQLKKLDLQCEEVLQARVVDMWTDDEPDSASVLPLLRQ